MTNVLELRGITKAFPGVLANDHINLSLQKSEILALLGENGAGKTTLMNILYGLYKPDEGKILINDQEVEIHQPTDAIHLGIGMVHQHFMLIPVMTVTENIMLGVEPTHEGIFLDKNLVKKKILEISEQYGLEVDPDTYISELPVGIQQRVEIIKVLYRQAETLILDEPTAVLTPQEVESLFKILRTLVENGKSIIFITHKLKEVMELADRITVLRGGRVVDTVIPKDTTQEKLASLMVGREVNLVVKKKIANPKDIVLEVKDLCVLDDRKELAVDNVTFDVHQGEVLGIAGVQGNGQTELVYALTGLSRAVQGSIQIMNKEFVHSTPRQILEAGVGHIPEDRQKHGLILPFPVHDNLVLCTYYLPPFAHGMNLQQQVINKSAENLVELFDIRPRNIDNSAASLSGGNQQKVIIARELSRPICLLVASQPTRGLDVGSIEYIHNRIIEKREEGAAVLLVSPELDEIIALSDRIAVMYKGKIVEIIPAPRVNRDYLGLLMAGIKPADARITTSPTTEEVEVERVF